VQALGDILGSVVRTMVRMIGAALIVALVTAPALAMVCASVCPAHVFQGDHRAAAATAETHVHGATMNHDDHVRATHETTTTRLEVSAPRCGNADATVAAVTAGRNGSAVQVLVIAAAHRLPSLAGRSDPRPTDSRITPGLDSTARISILLTLRI